MTVRLFALLQKHLPEGSRGKATVEVPEGATAGDVLSALGVPRHSVHLVMRDGEHVDWDAPVSSGDALTVFPPVAGG